MRHLAKFIALHKALDIDRPVVDGLHGVRQQLRIKPHMGGHTRRVAPGKTKEHGIVHVRIELMQFLDAVQRIETIPRHLQEHTPVANGKDPCRRHLKRLFETVVRAMFGPPVQAVSRKGDLAAWLGFMAGRIKY